MKPPKTTLDLLIQELESERRSLKRMIKDAAAEHDNLIVFYHSQALLDLNRRLSLFYNFRDPYFSQKEELQRQIDMWRKGVFMKGWRPELRERVKKRNEERALELENQLSKLKTDVQPFIPSGTQFIDEALLALRGKRCRSFELIANHGDEDEQWSLIFREKKSKLIIELKGDFYIHDPDFVIADRIPDPLRAAGFIFDPQSKKGIKSFNITTPYNIKPIKQWLAKFLIEGMGYYWPGGKMSLVYK